MFLQIYENLCNTRKANKAIYGPGSELHQHHIIPTHSGGKDEDDNYTYLTVREHIIAHYLLWKIHKNPNDLRSMNMLGANLSVEKRRVIGIFCRDNKIGFHKFTREELSVFGRIGGNMVRDQKLGFLSLPKEVHAENARIAAKKGGKATFEKKAGMFALSDEQKKLNQIAGGKASGGMLRGFKYWTKDGKKVISKTCPGDGWINTVIKSDKQNSFFDEYLSQNFQLKILDRNTGEKSAIFLPRTISLGEYLKDNPHISINKKVIHAKKHGIYINLNQTNVMRFVGMGWTILKPKESYHCKAEDFLKRKLVKMSHGDVTTRVDEHLIDTFKQEGWTDISLNNAFQCIKFNDYVIYVKTELIQHFLNIGWELISHGVAKKRVKESTQRRCGTSMILECASVVMKVQYKDIPLFESNGWKIIATEKKTLRGIRKAIAATSSSSAEL